MSKQKPEKILLSLKIDQEHKPTFKQWFEALKILGQDSRDLIYLTKTKDALRISMMCPDRVSLIETEFDKDFFSVWDEKEIRFNFRYNEFLKILKNLNDKETGLQFTITDKKLFTKENNLRIGIEITIEEVSEYPSPKTDFKAKGILDSKQLLKSLSIAWNLKIDHMRFQVLESNAFLKLFAESGKFLFNDLLPFISSEIQEESSGMWSTSYLNELRAASKLADELIIGYSSAMPLMFHWKFGVASYLKFFIAPRIET